MHFLYRPVRSFWSILIGSFTGMSKLNNSQDHPFRKRSENFPRPKKSVAPKRRQANKFPHHATRIDLFSTYALFCHSDHVMLLEGIVSFKCRLMRVQMYAWLIKKQKENSHEGITWSKIGKQNVQAKKVYCIVLGVLGLHDTSLVNQNHRAIVLSVRGLVKYSPVSCY